LPDSFLKVNLLCCLGADAENNSRALSVNLTQFMQQRVTHIPQLTQGTNDKL